MPGPLKYVRTAVYYDLANKRRTKSPAGFGFNQVLLGFLLTQLLKKRKPNKTNKKYLKKLRIAIDNKKKQVYYMDKV